MVHTYPLLHVVTYMTRIGYNALFTPLIAKACVVQWIESVGLQIQGPTVRITASADTFLFIEKLFIEKFTEYFQTFIYILAKLSVCILCI